MVRVMDWIVTPVGRELTVQVKGRMTPMPRVHEVVILRLFCVRPKIFVFARGVLTVATEEPNLPRESRREWKHMNVQRAVKPRSLVVLGEVVYRPVLRLLDEQYLLCKIGIVMQHHRSVFRRREEHQVAVPKRLDEIRAKSMGVGRHAKMADHVARTDEPRPQMIHERFVLDDRIAHDTQCVRKVEVVGLLQ